MTQSPRALADLTVEQIEEWRARWNGEYLGCSQEIDALCDLALSALRAQAPAQPELWQRAAENLSMMLRRMIWQINKMDGDSGLKVLAGKASDLIKQYGLQGSPLRGGEARDAAAPSSGKNEPAPEAVAAWEVSERGGKPFVTYHRPSEEDCAEHELSLTRLYRHPAPASSPHQAVELLREACKPWEFCHGEPPEWESPLMDVWQAAVVWTCDRLAGVAEISEYEQGDGSESLEGDVDATLSNILAKYDEARAHLAALPKGRA